MTAPVVVMANVLGGAAAAETGPAPPLDERIHHFMAHWPDVKLHWYGKGQRPGRKLGHVTALGTTSRRSAPGRSRRPGTWPTAWWTPPSPSMRSTEEPAWATRSSASSWAATPTGR